MQGLEANSELLACSIVTLERAMLSTACRAAAPAAAAALCVQYAPHGCRAPAEPERHDQSCVKIADAPAAAHGGLRRSVGRQHECRDAAVAHHRR